MDFAIESTSTGGQDYRWLGNTHGIDTAQPGTLDLSKFTGALAPDVNGTIPSGVAVGKITASGLYAPFDSTKADGTQILAGFIFGDVDTFNSKGVTVASGKAAFALLKQGTIKRSMLPIVSQRTAITYQTASDGQFVYAD